MQTGSAQTVDVENLRNILVPLAVDVTAANVVAQVLRGLTQMEQELEDALRECGRLRELVTAARMNALPEMEALRRNVQQGDRAATDAQLLASEASERAYQEAQNANRLGGLHLKNSDTIRRLRKELAERRRRDGRVTGLLQSWMARLGRSRLP